ncbi:hypothetical protein AMS68_002502 [Peltaster fructicola]|uniref:Zn(2)-C6 fungal-type domain-containing protein n=1 Tax=Peltaster fructicola TaxID=286661 RepID=A0A6H0XQS4_9PEZI|nr:hypothetical protein AMS68_002502 [Peltaster fructicola]
MSAPSALNGTPAFDRSKSAGFTAVNETSSTSFRPLADEESITVARHPSQPRDRTPQPQPDQSSDRQQVAPANNSSAQDTTVNDSPPAKKQRLSDAGAEQPATLSPESTNDHAGHTPDSVSSVTPTDTTMIDDDDESMRLTSGASEAGRVEPQVWNPQEIRPETSRDLQERLQSHLNGKARASSDNSMNESLQTNGDAGNGPTESSGTDQPTRRKRDFAHRTKTGCHTCRQRKKKCDEGKPICQNCIRGKFNCGGYGPNNKNVNYKRPVNAKVQHIIQAKPMEFSSPVRGPTGPTEPQWHGPPPGYPPYDPSRHGQPHAPPMQPYGPPGHEVRDGWNRPPYPDAQHIHLQYNKLPHVDYTPIHIPPFQGEQTRPPGPDSFAPLSYRTSGPNGSSFPPHDSSSSRRGSHLPPMQTEREWSERDKMLVGQPYRHWKDRSLNADRLDCKTAIDLYNRASLPAEAMSPDVRASRFAAVLDPTKRTSHHGDANLLGRVGTCGERTIVESPFYCDYGYNLNIGAETVIYAGCYIQDPCEISIGNRCTIGPNVNFYGMTFSIDTKSTAGSQGNFLGGSIRVEDDCKIGGNVTILAYRVIGKGAIVAAGSVVTRPYTIVAGNPAKEVRTINESTTDRRMRTEIQEENDRMIEEMRRKRNIRLPGPGPGRL